MTIEEIKTEFQKYSEYQDSGEYWMGKIPSSWELKRLKHLFFEKKIKHNIELNCGSISFGKVVYKDDDKIPHSTKASYQEVLEGEFLINPLNLNYDLISLRIALSDKNVVVSSGYIVLKNKEQIDKNYYKWLLHRYDVAYMKLLGSGVRQTINFNHIANSVLAYPPLKEQSAIANFLDEKCTKIDKAISQKQKMIALLKERKQILIQNAVTKGLDSDVEMKDSGVEWIGEIPGHWEVKRLKNLIKDLEGGVSVNASESESAHDDEVGVLKTSSVYTYSFNKNENKKVFKSDLKRVSCPVKKGRIIISRMNAPELVGASGYVKEACPNLYLPDRLWQTVFYSNIEFDSYWLSVILTSVSFRAVITSLANGSSPSMKNISKPDFLNICIPFPMYSEQKQIVTHIQTQSTKIDKAIALQERQIERLKEYKSVLIDAAVTGKIKVC